MVEEIKLKLTENELSQKEISDISGAMKCQGNQSLIDSRSESIRLEYRYLDGIGGNGLDH